MTDPIRAFIVDDHSIVRYGIRQILDSAPNIELSGEAATAAEFFSKLKTAKFDVLVLDVSLKKRNGIEILKELKKKRPEIKVLILTMHSEDQYAVRAFRAGAFGYLNKEKALDELVTAIEKVAAGEKYIHPDSAGELFSKLVSSPGESDHELLSDREFEVMKEIGAGKSLTEIAEKMLLSVKTVSTYRSRILEKLNFQNNADITRYLVANRILSAS